GGAFEKVFAIAVTNANDAPSFTKGADESVLEDSGARTVTGWATAISAGPAGEAGQSVSFPVAGDTNPSLFAVAPAVSSTGTLTDAFATDAVRSAVITLVAKDDGGTAEGGGDTTAPRTFPSAGTGVNDPPSFTVPAAAPTVLEDSGPQMVPGFATAISAGPANESGQSLHFAFVSNSNPSLFVPITGLPLLDSATGDLT